MHLNMAKGSPGDKITRVRHGADAAKHQGGRNSGQRSWPGLGGPHTAVFVDGQKDLKGREQTSKFVYLHGLVKFVSKEERLVLDTLNW